LAKNVLEDVKAFSFPWRGICRIAPLLVIVRQNTPFPRSMSILFLSVGGFQECLSFQWV
jgi:hypothetical protein